MNKLAATSSDPTTIAPIRPVLSISLFSATSLSSIPNPRPIANMPMMNMTFGSAPPRNSMPSPPENIDGMYIENAFSSDRHLPLYRRIVYHIHTILLKPALLPDRRRTLRQMPPPPAARPRYAVGPYRATAPARSHLYRRSHRE